jgi:aryl-alcohol dehydrogenase-like predicted oxidoreductase
MEYRTLGRTGVKVSALCLGAMNFGGPTPEAESTRLIHKALDAGINFIDTANVYNAGESERLVGRAIAGGKRAKIVLATKAHFPQSEDVNDRGNTRRHLRQAVDDSLRRLQTDFIDLYQIHRPMFDIPQEETLGALDSLVRQGKVLYIGCSTHPAWLVMEALSISEKHGWAGYATEQPPYNLLDRRIENELIPLAQRYGLGLIPWAPLAMGVLAGRYEQVSQPPPDSRAARIGWLAEGRVTERGVAVAREVARIAREHHLTPSQLALLWVKEQPGITSPIIGPRTEAHLDDQLEVADLRLDPAIAAALDELVPPGSAVANFHNNSGWMKMSIR